MWQPDTAAQIPMSLSATLTGVKFLDEILRVFARSYTGAGGESVQAVPDNKGIAAFDRSSIPQYLLDVMHLWTER